MNIPRYRVYMVRCEKCAIASDDGAHIGKVGNCPTCGARNVSLSVQLSAVETPPQATMIGGEITRRHRDYVNFGRGIVAFEEVIDHENWREGLQAIMYVRNEVVGSSIIWFPAVRDPFDSSDSELAKMRRPSKAALIADILRTHA